MRIPGVILAILVLASTVSAQTLAPGVQSPRISINMENAPLKQALQGMLKYLSQPCDIDPALDGPPYDKIKVTLHVQNADLYEALTGLLSSNGLTMVPVGNRYAIKPFAPGPEASSMAKSAQSQFGTGWQASELVTMNIPQMPVKDALAMVCPNCGWTFGNDLGRTIMPGAKFYQFPREMAAAAVVTAAGLIPPMGNSTQIKARGRADLTANYQYMPARAQNQIPASQSGYATQNYFYADQMANNVQQHALQEGISLAAYGMGSQMRFTILANQARDTDLLDRLFTLSGKSCVMGDLSVRPAASSSSRPGQPVISRGKAITAQLRNVTLDDALNSLLPPCNLKYRKMGFANNPTYIVEPLAHSSADVPPAAPSASPAPVPR